LATISPLFSFLLNIYITIYQTILFYFFTVFFKKKSNLISALYHINHFLLLFKLKNPQQNSLLNAHLYSTIISQYWCVSLNKSLNQSLLKKKKIKCLLKPSCQHCEKKIWYVTFIFTIYSLKYHRLLLCPNHNIDRNFSNKNDNILLFVWHYNFKCKKITFLFYYYLILFTWQCQSTLI
jgi:hypothetical protein